MTIGNAKSNGCNFELLLDFMDMLDVMSASGAQEGRIMENAKQYDQKRYTNISATGVDKALWVLNYPYPLFPKI
jgi:hypothetical protein